MVSIGLISVTDNSEAIAYDLMAVSLGTFIVAFRGNRNTREISKN